MLRTHYLDSLVAEKFGPEAKYDITHEFEVLYPGWECDSEAHVISVAGKNYVVLTNHGRPYFATAQELNERIKFYKDTISATEKAIKLVGED